jgi:TRAP-type C4-dicarboxylate transport system substrate-binding protein
MERRARKLILILFSIIVIGCMIMPSCSKTETPTTPSTGTSTPQTKPSEPIKLKFATGIMEQEIPSVLMQHWMDLVSEKTGGQVEFDCYWGGTLGNVMEMLELLRSGSVDLACVMPLFHPAELPLHGILNQGGWSSMEMASNGIAEMQWESEVTAPLFEEEGKKQNLRYVLWPNIGTSSIVSRTEATTMADLKGKKSTRFGYVADKVYAEFDMIPVATTSAEMYESLSKGVIDCVFASLTGIVPRKLHEPAVSFINVPIYWCGASHAINYETWESLPAEVQQAMIDAEKEMRSYNINLIKEKEAEFIQVMKDAGMTITMQLPAGEMERMWKVWLGTFQTDWVNDQEKFGVKDQAKIIADYFAELNK